MLEQDQLDKLVALRILMDILRPGSLTVRLYSGEEGEWSQEPAQEGRGGGQAERESRGERVH